MVRKNLFTGQQWRNRLNSPLLGIHLPVFKLGCLSFVIELYMLFICPELKSFISYMSCEYY